MITHRNPGIRKSTVQGTLRIVYGAPDSREAFLLREKHGADESRVAIMRLLGGRSRRSGTWSTG